MAKVILRVPSLQQVIKNLNDKPKLVQRALVRTALNPPRISYRLLNKATQDRVCWNVPLAQIQDVIRKAENRPPLRENLLKLLSLIDGHFDSIAPDYPPIEVECRYYQIAPDIKILFQPPICYGIGGQLYLPYFNFWRRSPLKGKRLSVFMTILDDIRKQEPDIETARMPILDFSIPPEEEERKLAVINENDVERVAPSELQHWMQIFAEGYRAARAELAGRKPEATEKRDDTSRPDDGQDDLFRPKPGG
jgi:hypothetical protein